MNPELPAGAVAGPLSIRDLTELLGRLPASERAALSWAPAALEQEIRPLVESTLTRKVVMASTRGVLRILMQLLPSLVKQIGPDRFIAEVDGADAGALQRLRASLPDAGARRSADWVFRAIRGFIRLMAEVPHEQLATLGEPKPTDADLDKLLDDDEAGILRGVVLLMAAITIADQGGDPERAAELCDLAFLETSRATDRLVSSGMAFALEPRTASPERNREILEMVEEARAALAPEDADTLSFARLRDLR